MGWFDWWNRRDERHIFRFRDGETERAVDPLATWLRMIDHPTIDYGPVIQSHMREPMLADTLEQIIKLARDTFELKPFTQGGSTDSEAYETFAKFWAYLEGSKKNIERPLRRRHFSELLSSAPSTTNSDSASSSTSSEHAPAGEPTSPSASAGP